MFKRKIESESEKLNKICRTCALDLNNGTVENVICIFRESSGRETKDNINKIVIAKELKLIDIEVRKNDGLPQVICKICFDILKNLHEFRILAQSSQVTLRKQFRIKPPEENTSTDVKIKLEKDDSFEYQTTNDINMKDVNFKKEVDDILKDENEIDEDSHENNEDNSIDYDFDTICEEKQRNCWYCYESFVSSKELIDHEREHDEEKYHFCYRCGEMFKTPLNLRLHIKKHVNIPRIFICEFCGDVLRSLRGIHRHVRSHREKLEPKDPNSSESKPESNKRKLERPYKCPLCAQDFVISQALEKHLKLHDKNLKYRCNLCGLGYMRQDHLKRHINVTHLKAKIYQCEYCDEQFMEDSSKLRHVRRHFSGQNHECEHCGKAFRTIDLLKCHKQKHMTEPKYFCKICGKSFPIGRLLREHERKHAKEQHQLIQETIITDALRTHHIDL